VSSLLAEKLLADVVDCFTHFVQGASQFVHFTAQLILFVVSVITVVILVVAAVVVAMSASLHFLGNVMHTGCMEMFDGYH